MKSPADCTMCGDCGWAGARLCAYHQGMRDGAAEERARVLAYLEEWSRDCRSANPGESVMTTTLAGKFKRGAHVTAAKGGGE